MFLKFLLAFASLLMVCAPVQAKISLALNWKPEPQFGGFYAADYSKLQVDILEGGSGTPTVQMVSAGKVEFGVISGDELLLARARGSDVVALFAVYQTFPQSIMVHDESRAKSLAEVFQSPGLLAVQKGLPYVAFLTKKYAPLKVKLVPYLGGIGPFIQNPNYSQQCIATSEPLTARAQGIKPKVFLIADSGFNPYSQVVVTRAKTLKEKPDLVKAFVQATRAGWDAYLKDGTATNIKMNKLNPSMELRVFEESARAQVPFIVTEETKKYGLGHMTDARWKTLAEQLVDLHLIPSVPVAADFLFQ